MTKRKKCRVLPFTRSLQLVPDLPDINVTVPESWEVVLTKTRMWVFPKDLMMVWCVSRNCRPSLNQNTSISSSSTSTQNAAFSPSSTSNLRGSFFTIVPRRPKHSYHKFAEQHPSHFSQKLKISIHFKKIDLKFHLKSELMCFFVSSCSWSC